MDYIGGVKNVIYRRATVTMLLNVYTCEVTQYIADIDTDLTFW